MGYGNTGNTTTTAPPGQVYHPTTNVIVADSGSTSVINQSVIDSFLSSLPTSEQSVTPLFLDGADSIGVDGYTYALVGQNSTVDFRGSATDDGQQVGLNVTIDGGANKVTLNKGPDVVRSTSGNDTIRSTGGHDTISGGSGSDSITGGGHSMISGGTSGADTLVGGLKLGSHDTIASGSGGGALINAKLGHNVIYGNTNDTIHAGQSQDTIDAGYGTQTITGGQGADITGGGQSSISGGTGNTISLMGHDTLSGGSDHHVTIAGNSQSYVDETHGRNVNVTVQAGGQGDDTLFGGGHFGLTIHVAQLGAVTSMGTTGDVHDVTFASGDTLHVNNVTLDFGNGHKQQV